MSETTQIQPDKIRAYLATDYRLGHTDNDIILTIGKRSERLAALFASGGFDCGAFITAYNPRGTTQSDEANDQAHAQLAGEIERLGLASIEGSGSEEGTDWPAEYSYFALDQTCRPPNSGQRRDSVGIQIQTEFATEFLEIPHGFHTNGP